MTRSNARQRRFNTSEIAGSLIAARISNIYDPAERLSVANTRSVWETMSCGIRFGCREGILAGYSNKGHLQE